MNFKFWVDTKFSDRKKKGNQITISNLKKNIYKIPIK